MTFFSLPPLSVYYCYDSADLAFSKALDIHLTPLKRNGWIHTWDHQQISAGQEWEQEQEIHLHTAHLLVLLISADFLASESGVHIIQVALQRHRIGEAIAIPIIVRAANWEETDLQALQVLPREQKAIATWPDQDSIWREVSGEIQRVVEAMRQLVFVAHSPEDQAFVEQLRQDMAHFGIFLWSLEAGQDEMRDAIRAAYAVILIASPDVSTSRLVKAQLALAADYQRPVLVVWARGEDWRTSNLGNRQIQEVIDARGKRYEAARNVILMRLRQGVFLLPFLVRPERHTEPRNPYKGLHAFTRDDAGDFFGREALIDELVTAVETMITLEKKGSQHLRLLPVIGPSGSGKSSVVMAGLLPCLQFGGIFDSEEWIYLDPLFPGAHPLESLAVSLAPQFPARSVFSLLEDLASDSARALHLLARQLVLASQRKVVLVVDQFEETFTLTMSEEEREHFLELLVTAVTEPYGPLLVILTLRADFYDRPMQYPEFYRLIDAHHISILPMESDDLRKVIERPAQLPDVQLTFEENLLGDLLFEMRGQVGALPLLQFTLDQLFERRDEHLLTVHAYHEIGGVKGALSRHAEQTYQDLPSPEHQVMTRTLFVRLIEPGMAEQDTTRRRALLSEFDLADVSGKHQMQETLEIFIKARLLTTNQSRGTTTVEVSHETVIREWKRLSDWLNEAREDIRFQQSLSNDVAEWEQRKQPKDRLYRGAQLKEAQIWAKHNIPSEREGAFLRASMARQRLLYVLLVTVVLLLVSSTGFAGWIALTQPPNPTLVTTLQDNVNGSLRYCINNAPAGSTITFASSLRGTIKLTGGNLVFVGGRQLTISGLGADQITISGGDTNANILVSKDAMLNISGLSFKNSKTTIFGFLNNEGILTISNSLISNNEENANNSGYGGGIFNYTTGTLTIIKSTISNNKVIHHNVGEGGGIENQGKLTVTNSTISNNSVSSSDNSSSGYGGGIYNSPTGTFRLINSIVSNNSIISSNSSFSNSGGGIDNAGSTSVNNSIISNNFVSGGSSFGGGIDNTKGAITVTNSTISNNIVTGSDKIGGIGGGIDNEDKLTVMNSTISNNKAIGSAGYGGGVYNYTEGIIWLGSSTISNNLASGSKGDSAGGGIDNGGNLILTNTTVVNNKAIGNSISNGGGIWSQAFKKGTVTIIYFSTIYGNTSKAGGGIWVDPTGSSHLTTGSSIVATNNAHEGPDISGLLISRGYNLLGNVSGVSGLDPTTDRQVTLSNLRVDSTLHNNGGPTQTLALLPGSSAINAIPLQACRITFSGDFPGHTETITTDQRGDPRPGSLENACDIGAFESSY